METSGPFRPRSVSDLRHVHGVLDHLDSSGRRGAGRPWTRPILPGVACGVGGAGGGKQQQAEENINMQHRTSNVEMQVGFGLFHSLGTILGFHSDEALLSQINCSSALWAGREAGRQRSLFSAPPLVSCFRHTPEVTSPAGLRRAGRQECEARVDARCRQAERRGLSGIG